MKNRNKTLILVILSLIAGLVYLAPFFRFSFYDQMKDALNLTDIQIGSIGFIYGLFNVLGYIPTGIIAEKFNTKKMLILSCLGMGLVTVWYSFYPGYAMYLVIHALYGVFSVWTFWSPYLKAVRKLGSEEEQSRLYGISEGLRGVAQTVVAFICLGALGMFAGTMVGFRVMILINAAVFFLLMIAVIVLVPDFDKENAEDEETPKQENVIVGMFKMLGNSSTWICIFVIMCGYCLWNTVNGYVGTYCTRVLQLSPSVSSTLSIIRSYVIVFVAGVSGGIIMDKFKSRGFGLMLVYIGIIITSIATMGLSHITLICACVTIVISYLVNVIKATYWSILGDAGIPVAQTGLATGIISLIGLTPDFFVSPIISRFIAYGESVGNVALGFNMMYIWMIVWAVLGIVAALILKKRKEKLIKA